MSLIYFNNIIKIVITKRYKLLINNINGGNNMNKIEEKIYQILREELDFDFKFSRELDLVEDLGIDSIQILNIILELEDSFNMEFTDEQLDLDTISKVSTIVEIVQGKKNV